MTATASTPNAFERFFIRVGHVIAWPFAHGAQFVELVATAMKDEPAAKAAVVGLVTQIKIVTEDSALALAAKGLDVPEDIQTVEDAKRLWAYVTDVFLPAAEAVYKDLNLDVEQPADLAPSASAFAPGLHTITAD